MGDLAAAYRAVAEALEAALLHEDPSAQCTALEAVLVEAEALLTTFPQDADLHHLAGLAWYHHPDAHTALAHAETYFARALAQNPTHVFARTYLGHTQFDQGHFAAAAQTFAAVDLSYFTARDQAWRVLKIEELRLVCHLHLSPETVSEAEFDGLVQTYRAAEETERAHPTELVRCVAYYMPLATQKRFASLVCTLLEHLALTQVFAAEYALLQAKNHA